MEHNAWNEFSAWLQAQAAACKARQTALAADDRQDEAVFEAIRANVYGIFHTVLQAGCKTCGGDPRRTRDFFAAKLEQIPANWHTALNKAETHNDTAAAYIERLKLETAEQIRLQLAQLWKE